MINPKLKGLGARARSAALRGADLAESGLRRFYAALRRKISPPVSVYRRKGSLLIVDAPRIGGRVYMVSTDGPREIRVIGAALMIGGVTLDYPDAATAQAAFVQVRKELLPAGTGTWILRAAAALLVCLVVRGLFAGVAGPAAHRLAQSEATPLHGLAAAMAADPNFVPPDPAPQSLPGAPVGGDLADRIYRQSMADAQQAMHKAMPPQPAANVDGLSGFGLQDGPDHGPGCNPALAFKVDAK